jgi:hypothetical protein
MKTKLIYALVLSAICITSCDDDFLDRAPLDTITDETFWETEEHLILAVDAIYANIKAKNTVDMENMGDNTIWPSTTSYQLIGSGNFGNDLETLDNEWQSQFTGIRQANAFLENYNKADVPEARKEALAAEVRVIRALMYSYLTNFWGDVPLVTRPLNVDELRGPRDPKAEVIGSMNYTATATLLRVIRSCSPTKVICQGETIAKPSLQDCSWRRSPTTISAAKFRCPTRSYAGTLQNPSSTAIS